MQSAEIWDAFLWTAPVLNEPMIQVIWNLIRTRTHNRWRILMAFCVSKRTNIEKYAIKKKLCKNFIRVSLHIIYIILFELAMIVNKKVNSNVHIKCAIKFFKKKKKSQQSPNSIAYRQQQTIQINSKITSFFQQSFRFLFS